MGRRDADGSLVGSTREVVDAAHAEQLRTTAGIVDLPIDVPAPGGVSAVLGIPVLVDE